MRQGRQTALQADCARACGLQLQHLHMFVTHMTSTKHTLACRVVACCASLTCAAASTSVLVLPVPGGPNSTKGSLPDVPATMQRTAWACSGLLPTLALHQCLTCMSAR